MFRAAYAFSRHGTHSAPFLKPVQCVSRARNFSSAVLFPELPHNRVSYYTLLKSMRMMAGLRGEQSEFKVAMAGPASQEVAQELQEMVPSLRVEVFASPAADFGLSALTSACRGQGLDGIIITQPYHILPARSSDTVEALRQCLHDEAGALGFLWHRMPPRTFLVNGVSSFLPMDFAKAVRAGELLPALEAEEGESPVDWMAQHVAVAAGATPAFKPLKHKKCQGELVAAPAQLVRALRLLGDARVPGAGPEVAGDFDAACSRFCEEFGAEALKQPVEFHTFNTAVVPRKAKAAGKK